MRELSRGALCGLLAAVAMAGTGLAETEPLIQRTAREKCAQLAVGSPEEKEEVRQWILDLLAQQRHAAIAARTRVTSLKVQLARATEVKEIKEREHLEAQARHLTCKKIVEQQRVALRPALAAARLEEKLKDESLTAEQRADLQDQVQALKDRSRDVWIPILEAAKQPGILELINRAKVSIGYGADDAVAPESQRVFRDAMDLALEQEVQLGKELQVARRLEQNVKDDLIAATDDFELLAALKELYAQMKPCLDATREETNTAAAGLESSQPQVAQPPEPSTATEPQTGEPIDFSLEPSLDGKWTFQYDNPAKGTSAGSFDVTVKADGSLDGLVYFDELFGLGYAVEGHCDSVSGKISFRANGEGSYISIQGTVRRHPTFSLFLAGSGTVEYFAESPDFIDRGKGTWRTE